ncbi:MAG: O-antigen ligase family protein [Chitinophagales bacterium]
MNILFGKKYSSHRTFLLLFAVLLGLVTSRALISIATIALFANVLIDGQYRKTLQSFFKQNQLSVLGLLLGIVVLDFFIVGSFDVWLKEFTIKLPFLVFPLAIIHWKNLNKMTIYHLLSAFVILITISGGVVLLNFLLHFEYYTNSLKMAQAIPTPHNHIRYSLLLALSTITSLHLFIQKHTLWTKNRHWTWALTAVFSFVLLHILSVRSGLATLYVALAFYMIFYIWKNKKWKLGCVLGALFFIVPFLAYKTIPSLQNKVGYMLYDLDQYRKGNVGENSDANRLRSLEIGCTIAQENIWTGVGVGNIQQTVNDYYETHNPTVEAANRKLPHNQFLWILIEMGIFGLLTFVFVVFYPLFKIKWKDNPLYICFWLILFLSFLVEATLEIQIGITIFAFFNSLLLSLSRYE